MTLTVAQAVHLTHWRRWLEDHADADEKSHRIVSNVVAAYEALGAEGDPEVSAR